MNFSQWPSPAKINLFLYITGQRENGYHELQTLFHFLDYGDNLSIMPTTAGDIIIEPEIPGVKLEDNLIYRAAKALQQYTNCKQGAYIKLEKILPMGGGLGGGSSNAATALIALNYLWKTKLNENTLAEIGVKLGADVPVFVRGQSAFAEGIGEQLQATNIKEKWYLVVNPHVEIATASIFSSPELQRDTKKRTLNELLSTNFSNDCENLVRQCFPEVDKAISWLLQYAPSRLTGTGACAFAEFDSEADARSTFNNLPDWLTGFVAQGVNISPLRKALNQA